MKVIKRNCELAEFDKSKIENAILKAMKAIAGTKDYEIATVIAEEIYNEHLNNEDEEIEIAKIEAEVFNKLIEKEQVLVAKSYEGYRRIREFQRDMINTTDKEINELLGGENEYWKTENSNKNATLLTTQRDYLAGITSKDITRRFLLAPDILQAHEDGIIHFHDMDYFAQRTMNNCCLINLEDMLQNGTMINGVKIEKPHRLITACTIATQIITAVTSSQYGGASISLTHLAPFVRDSYNIYLEKYRKRNNTEEECVRFAKEDLKKEIEDSVQTFNYQINSMTTTNGQSPFLSVFMYLGETEEYKEELAMLIEEFFKQRMLGFKNEKGVYVTPAFPKLLYVLEEDNIKEDSKYWWLTKKAVECSAKRFVPDYISEKKMKELKEGNCFPCMGCRSFLSPWKDENGNYKFYGRFNCGVVTLNLADIGLSARKDENTFWKLFEERTELCHKALLTRYNRLKGTSSDVAPILWQNGAFARLKKGENIDKLLVGGYATISLGFAGLYECTKAMTGESHTSEKGKKFALKVMKALNAKCDKWKEEDNLGYGLYGSPIESTTYKFATCLKKRFGVIEGITDRDYVTNSYHVPVFEKIDAYSKLALESEFQDLSTGGAISYVELPDMKQNIPILLDLVKFMYDNCMYAEWNIKSDYCMECGFDGEVLIDENLEWYCPNCGNRDHDKLSVSRRTCGYIGSNFWNKGRTQDIKERVLHIDDCDDEEEI